MGEDNKNDEEIIEDLFIVRRYSEIVREQLPDEPLSQGLAQKVDLDAEREKKGKYYVQEALTGIFGEAGQDPEYYDNLATTKLEELEKKSKELKLTWKKFIEKLKLPDDHDAENLKTPHLDVARIAIENAQAQMQKNKESKFGKVKAFFALSAQVLDNHNYLFDLLPTGDKYTSIFTGSFSAIVKATVTHDKIATELSEGFEEISDQVRSFYFVIKLHPKSTYIQYNISLFYFELFGFLITIMREWYQSSWKRLSRSLGSSFLDNTVRNTLHTLKQFTKRVEAEDARRQRLMTSRQLYALGAMMQASLAWQAKDSKRRDKFQKQMTESVKLLSGKIEDIGTMGPPPLPSHAIMAQMQIYDPEKPRLDPPLFVDIDTDVKLPPTWSRATLLSDTEHLISYLQNTHDITRLIDLSHSISVNTDIAIRVHKWVMNTSSEALCIQGPGGVSYPSQATLTSAFMLGNLRQVAIPVLVDFIQYDVRGSPAPPWDPAKEFLKIVYALVYQAARTVPEDFEPEMCPDIDLSTERLGLLKMEDVDDLPLALEILADLLSIGPPLQFIILDGLQLFDSSYVSTYVKKMVADFVTLLCHAVQETKSGKEKEKEKEKEKVIKLLFTTEGFVSPLAKTANGRLLSREMYEFEEEDEMLSIRGIDRIK